MLPDLRSVVLLQDLDNRAGELSREIAALPKHVAEIEKKLETHERKLEADRAALSANQKDRKRLESEIQMQEQKISKLRGQMPARRKGIVSSLTPHVYAAYERIRKNRGGVAVAEAIEGRCTCCHMSMRLQFFQDLKKSEQVRHCESCGRILYHNPPAAVED